jgi:hypothetical protein
MPFSSYSLFISRRWTSADGSVHTPFAVFRRAEPVWTRQGDLGIIGRPRRAGTSGLMMFAAEVEECFRELHAGYLLRKVKSSSVYDRASAAYLPRLVIYYPLERVYVDLPHSGDEKDREDNSPEPPSASQPGSWIPNWEIILLSDVECIETMFAGKCCALRFQSVPAPDQTSTILRRLRAAGVYHSSIARKNAQPAQADRPLRPVLCHPSDLTCGIKTEQNRPQQVC